MRQGAALSLGDQNAIMHNQLFAALGVSAPWYVQGVDFDAASKMLTIVIDFTAGSRFAHAQAAGLHPVHDTQVKRYRHLNFFQHECYLKVRTPRVKLPVGRVVLIEPDWAGKLAGFTLLFEALVLALAQYLPNARITFDKFHVVAHASSAVVKTRRMEQKTDPTLKGLRWALLKDRDRLPAAQRADLDSLIAQVTTKRTARAWLYHEQLREILDRK